MHVIRLGFCLKSTLIQYETANHNVWQELMSKQPRLSVLYVAQCQMISPLMNSEHTL